ncbi:MAG: DUF368 domain-containing protein [Candidatus Diapherotrites archaeon]
MLSCDFFRFFIRGLLMGAADILPGISGGTIAFITGIYERLIHAIKTLDFRVFLFLIKGNKAEAYKALASIDFEFLVPLLLGIGLSFFMLSGVVKSALDCCPDLTYAFFFGLIFGSVVVMSKNIPLKATKLGILLNVAVFLVSFLIAYNFVSLPQMFLGHDAYVLFFSGVAAACVMLLPGVSGAFLVLILGQYEYLIEALHTVNFPIILIFSFGLFFGFLGFSRILDYLLQRYKRITLVFLSGLVFGSLRLPLEKVMAAKPKDPTAVIFFAFLGMLIIFLIERKASLKKRKKQ